MSLFNIGGEWKLTQSNGPEVFLDLRQNGREFSGHAQVGGGAGGEIRSGEVSETNIHFVVFWDNGPIGDYEGVFGSDTRLRGSTFDATAPSSQALWHSEKQFRPL
jgi:hypothetical protein